MKKITVILTIILFSVCCNNNLLAQDENTKAVKEKYIKLYLADTVTLRENWVQYYYEDIFLKMKKNSNDLLPIFFDSYGSLYPDFKLLEGTSRNSFDVSHIKDKYTLKYSLWQFSANPSFYDAIKNNASKLKTKRDALYHNFILQIDKLEAFKKLEIDTFYKLWDDFRYTLAIEDIKERIKEIDADRVIFYVHGYNVPYGLAALQTLELKKFVQTYKSNESILFVPIFWPSNNMKNKTLGPKEINIDDYSKFGQGGLANGKNFWYYHNQALYAANGLRKILNGLEEIKTNKGKQLSVNLFSHSLGAVVVTSAVGNTFSKLKLNNYLQQYIGEDWDKIKAENPKTYHNLRTSDVLGFWLVEQLNNTPTPKLPMNIFLSAPAIPGRNTFMDYTNEELNRLGIFATSNTSDPVLTKRNVGLLNTLKIVTAGSFGPTTLGCNYRDEKSKTIQYFKERNAARSLNIIDLNVKDHDFFVYLDSVRYREHIKAMLDSPIPVSGAAANQSFEALYQKLLDVMLEGQFRPVAENRYNHKSRIIPFRNFSNYITGQFLLNKMVDTLVKIESSKGTDSKFAQTILPSSQEKISSITDVFPLVMLRRNISESYNPQYATFVLNKLTEAVDIQINKICAQNFPMYTYKTNNPQLIKFFSIRTGNDLFTPAGLTSATGDRWYWQNNDDRDYTGSLLIEVGTDYLGAPRRRNLNTYQTLFYGFDVFTPYFKDSTKFRSDTAFNEFDRPHASFQYFGWAKYGLSRNCGYRWSFNFKFGKIGGTNGADFQAALHQDISYSPKPRGWDAQISSPGRIGFSIEGTHEWDFRLTKHKRENKFTNFNFQPMLYWKAGTYMTIGGGAFQISNKNFSRNNPNYFNLRKKQFVISWLDNLMWAWSFSGHYVQHNTMLQGYGITATTENLHDKSIPASKYVLNRNRIHPWVFSNNVTVSYTALHFTVFYKWSSFSPETKNNDIGLKREPSDKNNMMIGKRWHHFAVIGISFNVVKY